MNDDHNQDSRNFNQPSDSSTSEHAPYDPRMPPYEDIAPTTEYTPRSPIAASMDVELRDHDMASPSDSESDRDAFEVEMQAVAGEESEDPPLPEIEAAVPASRPNNRRARVEDDEDDERDRRHPSQRIINPLASSSTPPSIPRRPSALRASSASTPNSLSAEHSSSSTPLNSSSSSSSSSSTPSSSQPHPMGSTPSTQQPPRQPGPTGRLPPFLSGGFAISIDFPFGPSPTLGGADAGTGTTGSGAGADAPAATSAPANDEPQPAANPPDGTQPRPMPEGLGLPPGFTEMFSNPNFLSELLGIEPDVEDPERADRLLAGLEEVPVGLVRRLERVGGMAGSSSSSGDELNGGDSGCAVCWEKLLNVEGTEEDSSADGDSKSKQKEPEEDKEKKPYPRIVSLPCAHVFHADCLRPWFSRPKQTTCPTCRFNIDPENLTYVPYRQRRRAQQDAASSSTSRTSTSATTPDHAPTTTPPAQPSPSEPSRGPASEESARGRSSSPTASGPPPRRAGSEPPSTRASRPSSLPESLIQSFSIPGGHVVVVSQPIGFITDAQGRPIAERSATNAAQQATPGDARSQTQSQPTDSPTGPNPSTQTPPSTSGPAPEQRPVFGPPPPPGLGMGARRVPGMPDGVIAFDIHFGPAPPGFLFGEGPRRAPQQQAQAQAQQPQPQPQSQPQSQPQQSESQATQDPSQPQRPQAPPLRVPGGLFGPAGVHFGPRQGGDMGFSILDLLRGFMGPPPAPGNQQQPASPSNASQPAQPPAASEEPQLHPTTDSAPSTNPTEATPAPAQSMPPSADNNNSSTPPPPSPGNAGDNNERESDAAFFRFLANTLGNPSAFLRLLLAAGLMGGIGGSGPGFRHGSPEPRETVKKEWTPPPAPGPTLRQRVERREQEAGLRCSDVSCGIGPSDDEPFVSPAQIATKQLSIHLAGDVSKPVCIHAFHSACLVSAERVASRGAEASIVGDDVEVSCPVCRGVGCVSKIDWDEGVQTLQ